MGRTGALTIALSVICFLLAVFCIQTGLGWARLEAPLPMGVSWLPACGALLMAVWLMVPVCAALARQGAGRVALLSLMLWAVASLYYIYASNNMSYTNDLGGHIARIQHSAQYWLDPYGYRGWQAHHPPLYYMITGVIYWVVDGYSNVDPVTAIRFFSWGCYLVFLAYNIACLQLMRLPKRAYEWSAVLVVLWPLGLHISSKVGPDPFYYTLYAAAFYHALRWYRGGHKPHLAHALVIAALALAARSSAMMIFTVIAVMMLAALLRRRLALRDAFAPPFLIAACAVALGVLANLADVFRSVSDMSGHLGYNNWYDNPYPFGIGHYFSLGWPLMLAQPFNSWSPLEGFWGYVVKSALFGEYGWGWPGVGLAMNLLVVAIVFYSALPFFLSRGFDRSALLPHIANFIVPFAFMMAFTAITHNMPSQDARYVYPSLLSLVVFFARSMELHERQNHYWLRKLGALLVMALAFLGVLFFWNNPR